jgi:hypothetical protein
VEGSYRRRNGCCKSPPVAEITIGRLAPVPLFPRPVSQARCLRSDFLRRGTCP